MDFDRFEDLLTEKMKNAMIIEPRTEIGKAFNDGVETMFNYAMAAMYQAKGKEGEK